MAGLPQLFADIQGHKARYEREQRETASLKDLRSSVTQRSGGFAQDVLEAREECEQLLRLIQSAKVDKDLITVRLSELKRQLEAQNSQFGALRATRDSLQDRRVQVRNDFLKESYESFQPLFRENLMDKKKANVSMIESLWRQVEDLDVKISQHEKKLSELKQAQDTLGGLEAEEKDLSAKIKRCQEAFELMQRTRTSSTETLMLEVAKLERSIEAEHVTQETLEKKLAALQGGSLSQE